MRGPRLVAVLSALLVAMSAAVVLAFGANEEGVRAWIRATARSSVALFLLVFVARPLRQLWRAPASAWLMKNRRHLGVSFAVSHFLHMCGLFWFAFGYPASYQAEVDPVTVVGGGFGFVLAYAMAATSTDGMVRRLGVARWRLLHRIGLWTLWVLFLFTFGGAAAVKPTAIYLTATGALLAALGVRVAAYVRARGRARAQAAA